MDWIKVVILGEEKRELKIAPPPQGTLQGLIPALRQAGVEELVHSLFDEKEEALRDGVMVFINDQNCYASGGIHAPVRAGDTILILRALVGG